MKTLCGPNSRQLMKRSEYDIHVATVDYLHALGPKLKSHFFHVPNEGRHTVKYRVKLKRLGVKAGVPDLLFVLPGGRLGCVELKSDKGRQSKAQKEFEKRVSIMTCRMCWHAARKKLSTRCASGVRCEPFSTQHARSVGRRSLAAS